MTHSLRGVVPCVTRDTLGSVHRVFSGTISLLKKGLTNIVLVKVKHAELSPNLTEATFIMKMKLIR